ncbi:MAG: hypothetical protein AB7D36_08995 [Oscillospiraceae bacterium]
MPNSDIKNRLDSLSIRYDMAGVTFRAYLYDDPKDYATIRINSNKQLVINGRCADINNFLGLQ